MVDQEKADRFGRELGFGGYGGEFTVGAERLVMTCDGVGTKLHIAEHFGIYDTIGIDLVAMCANDLICCGATPLTFMDYYAVEELDIVKSHKILSGIRNGCDMSGSKLVGGETAQLSPMFANPSWFDLAGFMVGHIRGSFDSSAIEIGDYIVGIPSSGLHSNGFTDIRNGYSELGEWMLKPTRIYVSEILSNMSKIKRCAHITGGGITGNLPRILSGYNYELEVELSEYWLGISDVLGYESDEMMGKFNCGYGMIMVVSDPSLLDIAGLEVIGGII